MPKVIKIVIIGLIQNVHNCMHYFQIYANLWQHDYLLQVKIVYSTYQNSNFEKVVSRATQLNFEWLNMLLGLINEF